MYVSKARQALVSITTKPARARGEANMNGMELGPLAAGRAGPVHPLKSNDGSLPQQQLDTATLLATGGCSR